MFVSVRRKGGVRAEARGLYKRRARWGQISCGELRRLGVSNAEIPRHLGIGCTSLYNYLKERVVVGLTGVVVFLMDGHSPARRCKGDL